MNYRQNTTEYSYQNYYEHINYRPDERQYRSNYQRRNLRANRNFNIRRKRNCFIRPARIYSKYERTPTAVTFSKERFSGEEETNISVKDLNYNTEFEDIDSTQAEIECFDLDLSDAETVHLEDEENNLPETSSATRLQESTKEDLNHNKIDYSKDNISATSVSSMSSHKKQTILSETTASENSKGASANRKLSSCSIEDDQNNKLSRYAIKSLEKNTNEKLFKNVANPLSKENIPMKSQSCTQKYRDVYNQKPARDKTNTAKCESRERDRKLASVCDSASVRKASMGNESDKQIERRSKSIASTVLDMPSLENNSVIVKINRDVLKSGTISEKSGKADESKAIRKDICKKNIEKEKSDDAVMTADVSEVLNNKAVKKGANIYAKVYKERIRDHTDLERKSEKDDRINSKHNQKPTKPSNNQDKHDKNNKANKTERSCDREKKMCTGRDEINENSKITKLMCIENKSPRSSNEILAKYNQRKYLDEKKQVSVTRQIATHESRASSSLLNDEGIKRLDQTLASLDSDNGLNSILNDKEVEEIMSKEPVKDASNCRKRGKSCIPLQQERCETEFKLVRSKSLQGKDLLCYTPFRITRSMSRNWLLSPGIPNGSVRETSNKSTLAKRRRSIDVCRTVTERRPSLFSEQTPYTKPAEIEFSFTPRHNDDFSENITETSSVTVIYRDSDLIDPRKTAGSTKIKYNGRELIKYNDLVKENTPNQRSRVNSKEGAPKKIAARRKSSVKNDDPDYVPHCKIVCSPRQNEPPIKNNVESTCENIIESLKSLTPVKRKLSNTFDIEVVDNKKRNEHANGLSMPILDDTRKDISPKRTFTGPSLNKESQLSKQKEYLAANLKYSDKFVSCVPHILKEVSVPLAVKQPRSFNAVTSIVADAQLLDATVRVTPTDASEQVQNPNRLDSAKASILNPFEQLRGTFERLGSYFFIIKALESTRIYQQTYLQILSIPDDVRTAEVGHLNIFFQGRLAYYIRKFHITCETIDWKRVSPDLFVNMLGRAIRDKRPSLKYDNFLDLLGLIMGKSTSLAARTNYMTKVLSYLQYIIELRKKNVPATSNVCANQNVRDQTTSKAATSKF